MWCAGGLRVGGRGLQVDCVWIAGGLQVDACGLRSGCSFPNLFGQLLAERWRGGWPDAGVEAGWALVCNLP